MSKVTEKYLVERIKNLEEEVEDLKAELKMKRRTIKCAKEVIEIQNNALTRLAKDSKILFSETGKTPCVSVSAYVWSDDAAFDELCVALDLDVDEALKQEETKNTEGEKEETNE